MARRVRQGSADRPGEVDETSWGEALLYGAILGLAVGAARVVAERKAAQYYRRSTGHLPSGDSVND